MLCFQYNIIEQAGQQADTALTCFNQNWVQQDVCFHDVKLVIVSIPSGFIHVQHAQDAPWRRQGIIDSGTGQMRENGVFAIVFSSSAVSLVFNASLTDNSEIAFSHQRSIYTGGWFLTGSCFAHVSFETNAGMSPHSLSTFPFLTKLLRVWNRFQNSLFLSQFLDGSDMRRRVFSNRLDLMKTIFRPGCSKLQEFMKQDPGWRFWVEMSAGGKGQQRYNTVKVWQHYAIGWSGNWQDAFLENLIFWVKDFNGHKVLGTRTFVFFFFFEWAFFSQLWTITYLRALFWRIQTFWHGTFWIFKHFFFSSPECLYFPVLLEA